MPADKSHFKEEQEHHRWLPHAIGILIPKRPTCKSPQKYMSQNSDGGLPAFQKFIEEAAKHMATNDDT